MALHHCVLISCFVGLVNCLACLHNFCFVETDCLKYNETLSQHLDVQHMMERRSGYAILQKTADFIKVIPSDLLSTDDPFVDVSSNMIQNHRQNNPETGLPQFQLHDYIAENIIILLERWARMRIDIFMYLTCRLPPPHFTHWVISCSSLE